jgi:bacterial/archaeal transporter family-2 protein
MHLVRHLCGRLPRPGNSIHFSIKGFPMTSLPFLILVAMIGGIAIALQAQFMGVMDKGVGTLESVFITYCTGGVLIATVMLLKRGGNLTAWHTLPGYVLISGVLGLIIVGAIGYSAPRLGLVPAFTIIVACQFTVGALLSHFGLLGAVVRPLALSQVVGVGVLLVGIWLIIR